MSYKKEKKSYCLMNDEVVRPLFKNSRVGKELTSRIISEVMNVSYEEIYNNLVYINDDRAFTTKVVDSKTDIMVETPKYFINIEICYTRGVTRNRQTDTYNYELYLSQVIKASNYKYMKEIIQIMIENYDYFDKGLFCYKVISMEEKLHLPDDNFITKYHINLDLLKEVSYNGIKYEKDSLKKMMYMFVCDEKNLEETYRGDAFMENVIKTAKEISGKEKIPLYLPESEIRRLDREEAVQEGYDTGYESGIIDGILRNKTEMTINLYNNGASLELISKSSGLTIEEVKKIIDENKQ